MVSLTALWLPILLSAVATFVASSIIHMVLPWHKGDYPKMAKEEEFMAALRPLAIPPGDYMVPRPSSPADMKSPAFIEKHRQGPVMVFTVMPNGNFSMGSNLVKWFIHTLVTVAYSVGIASRLVAPGAEFHHVFHVVGSIAFLGFAFALWQLAIWYRRSLRITLTSTLDGLIYALITAGIVAAMWPK